MKNRISPIITLFLLVSSVSLKAEVYQLICFAEKKEVNTKELQKFFNQANNDSHPTFDLCGAEITLDKVVRIKKVHDRTIRILGNNAVIHCRGGWIESGDTQGMIVANGSGKNDIMSNFDTYRIQDIVFKGYGSDLALRITGTYQSEIVRCKFDKFKSAVDAVFDLQMLIQHCEFKMCGYGLVIRSGMSIPGMESRHPQWFSNATGNNCSSNRSQVRDCRFFAGKDAEILLRVDASDGVLVENCIFEGFNPVYAIYADHRRSTTVPSFYVERPHFEFAEIDPQKSKALIHAKAGVLVHIEGMYSQYSKCTQIEAYAMQVVVEQPVYLPLWGENSLISLNGCRDWKFVDPKNEYTIFFEPKTWGGGIIPEQLIVQKHSNIYTYGAGYAIHELKGGTKIQQGQGRIKLHADDMIFINTDAFYLEENTLKKEVTGATTIRVFDELVRGFRKIELPE